MSTTAEHGTRKSASQVCEAALLWAEEHDGTRLTALLDHLVGSGYRIEDASEALAALLTDRCLDLSPARTVRVLRHDCGR